MNNIIKPNAINILVQNAGLSKTHATNIIEMIGDDLTTLNTITLQEFRTKYQNRDLIEGRLAQALILRTLQSWLLLENESITTTTNTTTNSTAKKSTILPYSNTITPYLQINIPITSPLHPIDCSIDGSFAFAPIDDTLVVIDLQQNNNNNSNSNKEKIITHLKVHQNTINSVHVSPRGDHIATGGDVGEIIIWEAKSFLYEKTLTPDDLGRMDVWQVQFNPTGEILCAGLSRGVLVIFDTTTWLITFKKNLHKDSIRRMAYYYFNNSDAQYCVVTASDDHTLKSTNVITGKEITTYVGHFSYVTSVVCSNQNCWVISSSMHYASCIAVWDFDGKMLHHIDSFKLELHDGIGTLALHPLEYVLASGSYQGEIMFWMLPELKLIHTISFAHTQAIRALCFIPMKNELLSYGKEEVIGLWKE
jgi:WD40 repeat protein